MVTGPEDEESGMDLNEYERGDWYAIEIPRSAQGTRILGYRDEDGHPVIPKGYVDDRPKDRSDIEQS